MLTAWIRTHRWHLLGALALLVLGAVVAGQLGAGAAAAIAAALATARSVARRQQGAVDAAVRVERVNAQRDGIKARAAEIVHEGERDARAAEAPGAGVVTEADTVGRWGRAKE